MSFSFSVKEEIIKNNSNRQKIKACLLGMLMYSNEFSDKSIVLQTENISVAEFFTKSISKITKNDNSVVATVVMRKNNTGLYTLSVENQNDRDALFEYLCIDNFSQINTEFIYKSIKKKFISFFIAGAFLSCGSINDPNKEYHIEFVIPTMELSNILGEIIMEQGIIAKQTERKNNQIVYLKESENIEDMLTMMGAPMCSLEIMNVKILKDVRNRTNRAVNCDSANIEKTIKASERQIEDIEYISKTVGLASLTDELRAIAELRLENPDWNLKELGNNLNPPISRSGANHRLTKLHSIAENLR